MDPNETLKQIRAIVKELLSPKARTISEDDEIALGQELAYAFDDLDGWLTKGGFSPWDSQNSCLHKPDWGSDIEGSSFKEGYFNISCKECGQRGIFPEDDPSTVDWSTVDWD